ncbi:MAG TPA: MMPL family transporter [Roseococcus sp.]|nr:MMPL family transporter [Roseococcus sp.]
MTRILAALALLATLGGLLAWSAPPRADLAEFLPEGRTPAARFLFRELQSGAATTLLLAAIEGAPREELARLSRETAAGLRASPHFAFVGDGTLRLGEEEEALLFRHRYLLSPETRPEAFAAEALRPKLEALLDGLRSAAGPVLARLGFADPTGAFLGLAMGWLGESQVDSFEGAWFVPDGQRALLLARGAGAGLDAPRQQAAMEAFRAAFAAANPPPGARLLLSGPGVFAAEAAAGIRRDVRLVSAASGLLLAGFLFWRFRSPALLALVAVPLLAATVAGYAAAVLLFGSVHAISLGFGMTMLGVVVDYPILLLTLRREDETLAEAAARIWPTLRLAAGAAAAGLLAMVGSGLPGLVQLGVFAGAGLVTAAAVTRWGLPWLRPEARFVAHPLPATLLRGLRALRGRRGPALAAVALAALTLVAQGGPTLQRDLAALSPIPAAQQALDGELRRQLGAPDVRSLFVIGPAASEAELLRRSEALGVALAPLVARGLLAGADLPSRYLPGAETQAARQAALPDGDALADALREAGAGLPFRPTAFAPFLRDVEESRTLPPLDLAGFAAGAPTLAARLSPLLTRQGDEAWAIAPASGVADPAALEAVSIAGALFLDVKLEMERLLAAYGRSTLLWALAGGAVVMGLLGVSLGHAAWRAAAPIGGALVMAVAALAALGEALSLFHLAALLLLAGLTIDYTLFLARRPDDAALGAVLTCALATLLTFGLLALCDTPVLRGIGLTVSLGVVAAFLLACAAAEGEVA